MNYWGMACWLVVGWTRWARPQTCCLARGAIREQERQIKQQKQWRYVYSICVLDVFVRVCMYLKCMRILWCVYWSHRYSWDPGQVGGQGTEQQQVSTSHWKQSLAAEPLTSDQDLSVDYLYHMDEPDVVTLQLFSSCVEVMTVGSRRKLPFSKFQTQTYGNTKHIYGNVGLQDVLNS